MNCDDKNHRLTLDQLADDKTNGVNDLTMYDALFDAQASVRNFRNVYRAAQGLPPDPLTPTVPDVATRRLAVKVMFEEVLELIAGCGFVVTPDGIHDAHTESDIIGVADGIADVMYTVNGIACAYGIDAAPILKAVCENNNLKLVNPTFNAAGKLQKPPGHKPPDIAGLLRAQGWQG